MLYTVNLEQDACVGSCLHLHNVLFRAERSRKVGAGCVGGGGYYVQKAACTSRKFNVRVLLAAFSTFMLPDGSVWHFMPG